MTSRDFRLIASGLADAAYYLKAGEHNRLVADFAALLAATNPHFDRDRFIAAATGAPLRNGDRPRERDYR